MQPQSRSTICISSILVILVDTTVASLVACLILNSEFYFFAYAEVIQFVFIGLLFFNPLGVGIISNLLLNTKSLPEGTVLKSTCRDYIARLAYDGDIQADQQPVFLYTAEKKPYFISLSPRIYVASTGVDDMLREDAHWLEYVHPDTFSRASVLLRNAALLSVLSVLLVLRIAEGFMWLIEFCTKVIFGIAGAAIGLFEGNMVGSFLAGYQIADKLFFLFTLLDNIITRIVTFIVRKTVCNVSANVVM